MPRASDSNLRPPRYISGLDQFPAVGPLPDPLIEPFSSTRVHLDGDDDFAPCVASPQVTESLGGFAKREGLIDDRPQLSLVDQVLDQRQVFDPRQRRHAQLLMYEPRHKHRPGHPADGAEPPAATRSVVENQNPMGGEHPPGNLTTSGS